MTDEIRREYYTLKQAADEIGITWVCLRDRAITFGIISPVSKGALVKLHRTQVEKLKFIHHQIAVEGRKTWKIKEMLTSFSTVARKSRQREGKTRPGPEISIYPADT